ncbi:hypothetical protein I8752_33755 [Nostocaceae cyanobacterium CENA369]|uniref:DUF5331 domain-containing protein n=1 Tax=Dendronalium phyllosphericum CENA369 TaxID=1725256 RepID=A0A8J7LI31_9NOST|nr:DUF5331 domain-containing protein [Dendronalium phyllosphericum]MBH8577841.1 hypothetical protein [Dendronalium phyllosphericum CENA369]
MDIQQLRQSLKLKWLSYYEQNRTWLVKMRIWDTYDGLRRPLSGFILATLSALEPEFDEILGFILELNNNPDRIIAALGLNFDPDEELHLIKLEDSLTADQVESESLKEEYWQDKPVPSFAVTKYQSSTKQLDSGQQPTEIRRSYQPVVSFAATTEVTRTHQPVPAIAVATKIAPQSLERMPNSSKLPAAILRQKLVRSSLEITTEVPVTAKTLPSPSLASEISSNGKKLSLLVTKEIQGNGNAKIQTLNISKKADLSSSTNARTLASWVDEFCQGSKWNQEETIAIPYELSLQVKS